MNKFILLTFYKFVNIENPEEEIILHRQICESLDIKGRIYIGEEGINATLTCEVSKVTKYRDYLNSHPLFNDIADIDVKATEVDTHQFKKLIVRYRREIVALGEVVNADDVQKSMVKMRVEEFKYLLDKGNEDFVVLDMRNNYEFDLGHFKGAIPAGTAQFRDLTKIVEDYKTEIADRKVIMYCTGGIRCEKAAVLLSKHGFDNVYQLDGGVVKYLNTIKDCNWLGNLYTFDERVSCDVENAPIISKSHYSDKPAKNYYNCRFGFCNRQFIALPEEYEKYYGFCSQECCQTALDTLYIRNSKIDPINHKELRGQIKQNPSRNEEIAGYIRQHILSNVKVEDIPIEKPKG